MRFIFLVICSLLTIASVVPYLIDIAKGKTKPNLASWTTWVLLTGITTAAELAAGEWISAIITGAAVVQTGSVVAFGLAKKAYVKYTIFDVACQMAAIVGIIIWQLFNSPAIGVICALVTNFISTLPTIRHALQKPNEETWITFAVCLLGAVLGVLALETYNLVSLPYPLYTVFVNILLCAVILRRRRVVR